jgi:UDP-N-acetylglucosamine transferase subunit ALG13
VIFLTVGTQLPFHRLVRVVDAWCARTSRDAVFGQIADPGPTGYRPENFEWTEFVDPAEFERRFESATLVVAHAGMGSIIPALALAKPIIVMPRRAALKEHRNDHQVASAARFAGHAGIVVADTEEQVGPELDRLLEGGAAVGSARLGPFAEPRLIETVRAAIFAKSPTAGAAP